MRSSGLILAGVLAVAGTALRAQAPPVHAPDGGTMERIQSIDIPPLPNAPFSATVTTEWTQYLENGATSIRRNSRRIARDARGRVFQERRSFLPGPGAPVASALTEIDIADPATHTAAVCDVRSRVCELMAYTQPAVPPLPPAGQNGALGIVRQSLGTQHSNGLELVGTRETQTLPGTAIGATIPLVVVKEFWYAPSLGVNISTRRDDPRGGLQVFDVTDIVTVDPDPSLFVLPANAQIIDRRRR
jgi:hypothetical protein